MGAVLAAPCKAEVRSSQDDGTLNFNDESDPYPSAPQNQLVEAFVDLRAQNSNKKIWPFCRNACMEACKTPVPQQTCFCISRVLLWLWILRGDRGGHSPEVLPAHVAESPPRGSPTSSCTLAMPSAYVMSSAHTYHLVLP